MSLVLPIVGLVFSASCGISIVQKEFDGSLWSQRGVLCNWLWPTSTAALSSFTFSRGWSRAEWLTRRETQVCLLSRVFTEYKWMICCCCCLLLNLHAHSQSFNSDYIARVSQTGHFSAFRHCKVRFSAFKLEFFSGFGYGWQHVSRCEIVLAI